MIFDALCLKCGIRKGVELPKTMQAQLAVWQAQEMADFMFCECGGYVDVQVYDGKLDKDRNIIREKQNDTSRG